MQKKYDIAIIGGGPGGSSSAIYLRKLGYSVIIFEKEKFPRDHVGESLIPYCYYKMKDMGVLDAIKPFTTKKPGVNFVDRDGKRQSVWCFDRILEDGAEISYHTLRASFDNALLQSAKNAGTEVLEEHTVKEVNLSDPENVTLRVADINGNEQNYSARFLIDASGQGSFLARKMQAKIPYDNLDRVAFFTHWLETNYDEALNGGLIKIVYLGGEKKGWIWVIPVGRNHLSIGVTLNNAYVREQKKKYSGDDWAKQLYLAEVAEASGLTGILENAVIEHDVQAIGDYSYRVEKKFGENWAMVGDSGAFLDPIFSSGVFVAMEGAERTAKCIDIQFREGKEAGQKQFAEEFKAIDNGLRLVEKFVRLFYDDDLLNFAHIGTNDDGYQKFLDAYEVFHYLIAGDFFTSAEKYIQFIDELTVEKNFNRFIHYVKSRAQEFPAKDFCRYSYDEVYGHLPDRPTVHAGLLSAVK